MRGFVERARVAYPNIKNERKLVELACSAYNNNVSRSTNQKPVDAATHAQDVRDYVAMQRSKNYAKNIQKYKSAEKFSLGDLVYRRIWKQFRKESDLENVSKNLYKIVKIVNTWPLPSYRLEDIHAGIVLPGTYQANVLVKK